MSAYRDRFEATNEGKLYCTGCGANPYECECPAYYAAKSAQHARTALRWSIFAAVVAAVNLFFQLTVIAFKNHWFGL